MNAATTLPAPSTQVSRHALVTGGGSGIGAAVAHRLAAAGLRVTLLGRHRDKLQAVAREAAARGQTLQCVCADVSDPAQVAAALAEARASWGAPDILVNNAGQAESAPFARMSMDLWSRMLQVNLTGTMVCTQAVLPDMVRAGWGRVVNVASTAGQVGYAYVSAYCAAKHGVIGLTRSLALEVARRGVTVNAVCPGYTETDIVHETIANIMNQTGRSAEEARAELVKSNPQGRLVTPAEVADAVAWLCSEGAGAITGQSLSVSGGEVS